VVDHRKELGRKLRWGFGRVRLGLRLQRERFGDVHLGRGLIEVMEPLSDLGGSLEASLGLLLQKLKQEFLHSLWNGCTWLEGRGGGVEVFLHGLLPRAGTVRG
jgi:hypothetical protein